MLADALRAESFRLTRNKGAVFWSVIFVPIFMVIASAIAAWAQKWQGEKLAEAITPPPGAPPIDLLQTGVPLNMGDSLIEVISGIANPFVLLFILIGATSIWAADYRFETWRLIIARNSRVNLMIGKIGVVMALILVAMVGLVIANALGDVVKSIVHERSLTFSMTGEGVGVLAALTALNWLRIVQVCLIGLFAAVLARSMLAALFVPIVVSVAQFLAPTILAGLGVMPDGWFPILISPGHGLDLLIGVITEDPNVARIADDVTLKAGLSLALWTLAPLVGAIALFQRQDLSKE